MSDTPSNEPAVVPSLDDVIGEFSASPAPQATPEPQASEPLNQGSQVNVDPYDPNSVQQYAQQQNNATNSLMQKVDKLTSKLTQFEQREAQQKVEADINAASKAISEKAGVDPLVAEVYLEKLAREKPGVQQIWDNRHTNQAAYKKMLDAVSKEVGDKFSAKADPELAENRSAASSKQSSPVQDMSDNPIQERLEEALSKGPNEFDAVWNQMISRGE